jgi:hypothetical protein
VVVGLVGILVVAYALPGLITSLSLMMTEGARTRELTRFTLANAAQAGLGLALILRPEQFLRLWSGPKPEAASA